MTGNNSLLDQEVGIVFDGGVVAGLVSSCMSFHYEFSALSTRSNLHWRRHLDLTWEGLSR
jgi:hypothetical protein